MKLVEKHIIKPSDPRYPACLAETRKSKDLRNAALFINRQHYAARNGKDFIEDVACDIDYNYVSWMTVDKLLKKMKHPAYKAMLANSAQETLKMVDQEYTLFIKKVAEYRDLDPNYVAELAHGKKYNGNEAKKLGLIDEIGSKSQSIEKAAKLSNATNYTVITYPEPQKKLTEILGENDIFNLKELIKI